MFDPPRVGHRLALMISALAISLVALFAVAPQSAWAADDDIASGDCGTCVWTIDANGKLTIAPEDGESGTLDDIYSAVDAPWYSYKADIKKVLFSRGVCANEDFREAFSGCSELSSVELRGLDTSRVEYIEGLFSGCQRLSSINLNPLDFSSLIAADEMFYNCSSLRSMDFSVLSGSPLERMDRMFAGCSKLGSVDMAGLVFPRVESSSNMFEDCSGLKWVDLSEAEFQSLSEMGLMFSGCSSLEEVNLSGLSVRCANEMYGLFSECRKLESISLDGLDCGVVLSMSGMFNDCSSLEKADFSKVKAGGLQDTSFMFAGCSSLRIVDLSGIDSEISESDSMFGDCGKLSVIYDDGRLSFSPGGDEPFWGCPKLRGGNGTAYVDGRDGVKYARIDKPGKPGCFTCKHPGVNKVEVDGSKYGFSSCYKCPTCTKLFSDSSAKREVKPKVRSVSLGKSGLTYSGKANRPSVRVVDAAGNVLRAGTDYSVSYADDGKGVGTHKVTVRGKGGYSFTKDLSFVVNPKGTSLSKVSKAKKALTAKWKKASGANGYQVRYSTKSNMAGAKSTTVKSAKTTSKKVTKLKKKTKYYVQVRTYKVVKGKTYYSGWSKARSVKTK